MKHSILSAILATAGIVLLPATLHATTLSQAKITTIVRDVKTVDPEKGARASSVGEKLQGRQAVQTGIQSRTELLFNDLTVTRIGANSQFSFSEGTRRLELYRGVILLQVPKGVGGAEIHTAAVTAAIAGTTVLVEAGKDYTKVIVIEGKVLLSANSDKRHRQVQATAGQAIILSNDAPRVPAPVYVNLKLLVKTSQLLTGNWGTELNWPLIRTSMAAQTPEAFTETNIAIIGPGTEAVFIPEVHLPELIAAGFLTPSSPGQGGQPNPPNKFGSLGTIGGSYVINGSTTIATDPTIATGGVTNTGKIYRNQKEDGLASAYLFGAPAVLDSTFDNTIPANGFAAFKFANLEIAGNPSIDISGGSTGLALVAEGSIVSGNPGGSVNFDGVDSLILGTVNGSINLGPELTSIGSTGSTLLSLYARGAGNSIILGSDVNLPNASLFLAAENIQGTSLSGKTLTLGGPATFSGDVAASGPVTGVSLFGNNLTFGGPAVFTGAVAATDAFVAASTFSAASLTAKTVSFPNAKFSPATLSQSGNSVTFNNLPIVTPGMTLLDVGGNSLKTTGNISLGAQHLKLGGNVITGGDIRASILTVNDVTLTTNTERIDSIDGTLTLLGSISGNRIVMSGPTIDFANGFSNTNLDVLIDSSTKISLGGTLSVKTFVGSARDEISSTKPDAKLDAEIVSLFLFPFGAGTDGKLVQTGPLAANFNDLSLDLTRTTVFKTDVDGNMTLEGNFVGSSKLASFELRGRSDVFLNGNISGDQVGIRADAGSISIGGKISALRSINLFAGTSMIDTSGFPPDQDHIAGRDINIQIAGSSAVFSQTALTRVVFGPLRLDVSKTLTLTLAANPTVVMGSISLPGIALTIDGMAQAVAINNLSALSAQSPSALAASSGSAPANGSDLSFDVESLFLGSGPGADSGMEVSGGDAEPVSAAAVGSGGSFTANTRSDISINRPITATTGRNLDSVATGGAGGTVDMTSQTGAITVNSTIEVSSNDSDQRRKSAKGGNIRLTSHKVLGTAIAINNSGQLKALLDAAAPGPGGKIIFTSAGGDILVNSGKIQADRGTVDIRNNGPSGLVSLNGATLAGDVVKVGALGNNGVLRVGGGSINANTIIKLYAGGSNGTVDFVDNVTLSGNSVKTIAAKTVNIANSKVVSVSGPAARVYTDNANYTGSGGNGSKTGKFGGSGASTSPFDHPDKPPFD